MRHVSTLFGIDIRIEFPPDDETISRLHRLAFGYSEESAHPWGQRLEQHSLTWVGAFLDEKLVGFVQVCWDGGSHVFILDTAVHPAHERRVHWSSGGPR